MPLKKGGEHLNQPAPSPLGRTSHLPHPPRLSQPSTAPLDCPHLSTTLSPPPQSWGGGFWKHAKPPPPQRPRHRSLVQANPGAWAVPLSLSPTPRPFSSPRVSNVLLGALGFTLNPVSTAPTRTQHANTCADEHGELARHEIMREPHSRSAAFYGSWKIHHRHMKLSEPPVTPATNPCPSSARVLAVLRSLIMLCAP